MSTPKVLGVDVDYAPPEGAMVVGVIGMVTFLDKDGDLCAWSFRSKTMPDHEALGLVESLKLELKEELTAQWWGAFVDDGDDE